MQPIGEIQSFGCLLGVDRTLDHVQFASMNAASMLYVGDALGGDNGPAGVPLRQILGSPLLHQARNVAGHGTLGVQRETVGRLELRGDDTVPFDVSIHRLDKAFVLEFQECGEEDVDDGADLERSVDRIATASTEADALEQCAAALRDVLGTGDVEVHAAGGRPGMESLVGAVETYEGLRFVADTDAPLIPVIGRIPSEHASATLKLPLALLSAADVAGSNAADGARSAFRLPIVVDGAPVAELRGRSAQPQNYLPSTQARAEILGRFAGLRIRSLRANSASSSGSASGATEAAPRRSFERSWPLRLALADLRSLARRLRSESPHLRALATDLDAACDVRGTNSQTGLGETIVPDTARFGRALVLEDSEILGEDLRRQLLQLGFGAVDLVETNEAAGRLLTTRTYDCAFLDVQLRYDLSVETACALRHRSIPFAFVSAVVDRVSLPSDLIQVPLLAKPLASEALMSYVDRALDSPLSTDLSTES